MSSWGYPSKLIAKIEQVVRKSHCKHDFWGPGDLSPSGGKGGNLVTISKVSVTDRATAPVWSIYMCMHT